MRNLFFGLLVLLVSSVVLAEEISTALADEIDDQVTCLHPYLSGFFEFRKALPNNVELQRFDAVLRKLVIGQERTVDGEQVVLHPGIKLPEEEWVIVVPVVPLTVQNSSLGEDDLASTSGNTIFLNCSKGMHLPKVILGSVLIHEMMHRERKNNHADLAEEVNIRIEIAKMMWEINWPGYRGMVEEIAAGNKFSRDDPRLGTIFPGLGTGDDRVTALAVILLDATIRRKSSQLLSRDVMLEIAGL